MKTQNTAELYTDFYGKGGNFFRFPNEYVIKAYSLCAKPDAHAGPSSAPGRFLDFAFGSGNNSVFFIMQGYEAHGVEVAASALPLLRENLRLYGLDQSHAERFRIIPDTWDRLPYEDGFFNFIVANHVIYYYATPEAWNKVTAELYRCLKPGGMLFFSMMAPNHTTCRQAERVEGGLLRTPDGNLAGQVFFTVDSIDKVKGLVPALEPVATGEYLEHWHGRNEHALWLYCGRKPLAPGGA